MKKNIHPKWYPDAKIICACGKSFTTGATKPEIHVEICSICHPFYTGETETRYIDTQRRVERFQKQQSTAEKRRKIKEEIQKKKAEKKPKVARSMREIMEEQRKV